MGRVGCLATGCRSILGWWWCDQPTTDYGRETVVGAGDSVPPLIDAAAVLATMMTPTLPPPPPPA